MILISLAFLLFFGCQLQSTKLNNMSLYVRGRSADYYPFYEIKNGSQLHAQLIEDVYYDPDEKCINASGEVYKTQTINLNKEQIHKIKQLMNKLKKSERESDNKIQDSPVVYIFLDGKLYYSDLIFKSDPNFSQKRHAHEDVINLMVEILSIAPFTNDSQWKLLYDAVLNECGDNSKY